MELKIGKKTEDALILEVIFVTLTENSSVVKNNSQGPWKYPHHRK